MDPLGQNSDLKEDFNLSEDNSKSLSFLIKKHLTLIIIVSIFVLLSIGTIILVIFLLNNNNSQPTPDSKKETPSNNLTIYKKINSIYSINDLNSNIFLF